MAYLLLLKFRARDIPKGALECVQAQEELHLAVSSSASRKPGRMSKLKQHRNVLDYVTAACVVADVAFAKPNTKLICHRGYFSVIGLAQTRRSLPSSPHTPCIT